MRPLGRSVSYGVLGAATIAGRRAAPTYLPPAALALTILDNGDGIGWPPDDIEIDADALRYKSHPEDWERGYGEQAATAIPNGATKR